MSKAAKFRYGRIYKAFFFEKPIVHPISATIIANSFDQALALVREQFPDRTISGFMAEDGFRTVAGYDAVIVAPNLPTTEPPALPCNAYGVPEECARSWYRAPKVEDLTPDPADENTHLT